MGRLLLQKTYTNLINFKCVAALFIKHHSWRLQRHHILTQFPRVSKYVLRTWNPNSAKSRFQETGYRSEFYNFLKFCTLVCTCTVEIINLGRRPLSNLMCICFSLYHPCIHCSIFQGNYPRFAQYTLYFPTQPDVLVFKDLYFRVTTPGLRSTLRTFHSNPLYLYPQVGLKHK